MQRDEAHHPSQAPWDVGCCGFDDDMPTEKERPRLSSVSSSFSFSPLPPSTGNYGSRNQIIGQPHHHYYHFACSHRVSSVLFDSTVAAYARTIRRSTPISLSLSLSFSTFYQEKKKSFAFSSLRPFRFILRPYHTLLALSSSVLFLLETSSGV